MTTQALLRLAWRESRTARRRLALYMSSIAFGVAALVAIDSFAGNVTRSIREQSRTLLGGDLAMSSRAVMPAVVDTVLDSLATQQVRAARVTTFASMALAEPSGGTRLVQVRAVSPGYPFYGAIETVPAAAWARVHEDTVVFVDASLLVALDAKVGDVVRLGQQAFTIGGTLGNVPGDAGIASVIGPRVYMSDKWVARTGLLRFTVGLVVSVAVGQFEMYREYLAAMPLRDALAAYLQGGLEWTREQLGFARFFAAAAYQGDPQLAESVVRPIASQMRRMRMRRMGISLPNRMRLGPTARMSCVKTSALVLALKSKRIWRVSANTSKALPTSSGQ